MDKNTIQTENAEQSFYPPVVAVLGHVDHGKTTLLDAIRKTSIASREFGGITQKIGTSTVEIINDGKPRRITFIDTPGHAAFSKMRSRGATAADISLLIVSAVDGVMPQTRESIQLLLAAKTPIITVLTKSDMPTKNPDKVKQQIVREGIMLEGLGGDVPVIEVSAQTGQNIPELLELILLVQELHAADFAGRSETAPLEAIVIESKLDPKSGPKATVIIKNGHLEPRETIYIDNKEFKIRSLMNERGEQLTRATIGDGIELLGMNIVPEVGAVIIDNKELAAANEPLKSATPLQREMVYQGQKKEENNVSIVLCADTEGSLEAIKYALPEEIKIVAQKTGEVSEADILLARSTRSLVISFNVRIRPDIAKLAQTEKVLAKNYNIIYEMLDEIKDVLEGKKLAEMEEIYGVAQVMAIFPFDKTLAYGVNVQDGRVAQRDKVRIMRGDTVIGETSINSLRIGKNPTSKVERGHEGGILLNHTLDIKLGDVILSHS